MASLGFLTLQNDKIFCDVAVFRFEKLLPEWTEQ